MSETERYEKESACRKISIKREKEKNLKYKEIKDTVKNKDTKDNINYKDTKDNIN